MGIANPVLSESSLPTQQDPGSETTHPGYREAVAAFEAVSSFVPQELMKGVTPPSPENPIVYAIAPGTGTPRQVAEGVPVAIPPVTESRGFVEKGRIEIGEGVHMITFGQLPVPSGSGMQGYLDKGPLSYTGEPESVK